MRRFLALLGLITALFYGVSPARAQFSNPVYMAIFGAPHASVLTPVTFSTSTGVMFSKDMTISTAPQTLAVFQATTSGTTLTVTSLTSGTIAIGQTIAGGTLTTQTITGGSGTSWTISAANTNATPFTVTATKAYFATPLGGVTNTGEATWAAWIHGTRANDGQGGATDLTTGSGASSTMLNGTEFNTNGGTVACEASVGTVPAPGPGWCIAALDNSAAGGQFNFNDSIGTGSSHGVNLSTNSQSTGFANGKWNLIIASYKTGHCTVYNVTTGMVNSACPSQVTSGIINDLANVNGAFVWNGQTGNASFGYMQDIYISQSYIGCTGVGTPYADCAADNTIAPSMLQKFRDATTGLAVDLGANCTGPTGVQPAICLTGDHIAMQTNKGYATGLAIHQAGAFPDPSAGGSVLEDAPYGAGTGIVAHTVTLKNIFYRPNPLGSNCPLVTTTGCTFATTSGGATLHAVNSGGQPLAVGDLRVLVLSFQGGAAHDFNVQCPTTDGTAWTGPVATFESSIFAYAAVCYKFVTSGAEPDYVTTLPTWTGGIASASWAMLTFANVASVQNLVTVARAASTTLSTPTSNFGASPGTMISIWTGPEGPGSFLPGRTYVYSGPGKRLLTPQQFGGEWIYIVSENVAAGAAGQRDLTRGSLSHGTSINFRLELLPN